MGSSVKQCVSIRVHRAKDKLPDVDDEGRLNASLPGKIPGLGAGFSRLRVGKVIYPPYLARMDKKRYKKGQKYQDAYTKGDTLNTAMRAVKPLNARSKHPREGGSDVSEEFQYLFHRPCVNPRDPSK